MNRKALAPYVTRSLAASANLLATDINGLVEFTGSSAQNLTVLADATALLPIGFEVTVIQSGTGSVTLVQDTGVTILSANGGLQLAGQYSAVTLVKKAANTWLAFGSLVDPFNWSRVSLTGSVVNNNATANTIADVTGLAFPVSAGLRYEFRAMCFYSSAATTTGSRWSINGPATPTFLAYDSEYPLTATAQTINRALTAYNNPAASNASSLTAGNIARIWGMIRPSAGGSVQVRFASEISGSAITALAGSYIEWRRLT